LLKPVHRSVVGLHAEPLSVSFRHDRAVVGKESIDGFGFDFFILFVTKNNLFPDDFFLRAVIFIKPFLILFLYFLNIEI
jgi:hypothetical protein